MRTSHWHARVRCFYSFERCCCKGAHARLVCAHTLEIHDVHYQLLKPFTKRNGIWWKANSCQIEVAVLVFRRSLRRVGAIAHLSVEERRHAFQIDTLARQLLRQTCNLHRSVLLPTNADCRRCNCTRHPTAMQSRR